MEKDMDMVKRIISIKENKNMGRRMDTEKKMDIITHLKENPKMINIGKENIKKKIIIGLNFLMRKDIIQY